MPIRLSNPLVETEWLEQHIHEPDLRIIDCHYGIQKIDGQVLLNSGKSAWEETHIPNSIYVDLLKELSDPATDLPFMQPPATQFGNIMSQKGIGDDSAVILYDWEKSQWATRLWFMFRDFGFSNVAILNGGWIKWLNEKRPVTSEPKSFTATTFSVRSHQPPYFTNKKDVLDSLSDNTTKRICALDRESFQMGHIPNSVNIEAESLFDPEDNTLLSVEELNQIFMNRELFNKDRIITYCGGSIAGSCVAFVLLLLGYENVSIYDGSMEEWCSDPSLPIEYVPH